MIRLTLSRHHHHHHYHYLTTANNQISSSKLIVYQHLNKFVFHCLLLLSLTCSIQSESNLTTKPLPPPTTPISLIDSDDLTTSYDFFTFNPLIRLENNSSAITESTIIDLITNVTIGYNSTDNHVDYNETTTTTTTTIKPKITSNHVTLFLDGDGEVNTLPTTTIKFDDNNNLTDSESITSNEIINSSSLSSTINPNIIFKSPTLPNIIKDDQETTTTINFNQTSETLIDLESPTTNTLTIDMINNNDTTINLTVISQPDNETTLPLSTDLLIDKSNQTICDSNNNQIADHTNQRLTIDHYEAKKFFLFTMILLGLCCLLILIVLILVVYIFRKLTRERTIKIPQVNNNNLTTGGGSIEFDTIKDGRFYQWQGNVNSGFDSSDLNESTTQSTGYRFLEGSVVPYADRYHNDIKASSTETFGHHHNQTSSTSINSLPKTITTVDTRL